jgi:hypothetical protein
MRKVEDTQHIEKLTGIKPTDFDQLITTYDETDKVFEGIKKY